jgi:arylsulfatase A-like enzyme
MTRATRSILSILAICIGPFCAVPAQAQSVAGSRPNILLIVGDDVGYGDLGPYLGGKARGMPTPSFDQLAEEGMTFSTFYAQPSCTPGRAAIQTGRIPNRSGMTTVAFQGQGGGLPVAEWTLASVIKNGISVKPTTRCRTRMATTR